MWGWWERIPIEDLTIEGGEGGEDEQDEIVKEVIACDCGDV